MINYQVSDNMVNLTFSKELLSSPEIVRFIEILRIKELLSNSQVNEETALKLDDELKENWWQKNKDTFLGKIQ
jgi:hypothetical protein